MGLSKKEQQHYLNLKKGFEGECDFDHLLNVLADDWLILNDLLLENNHTLFQVDTLLIDSQTIYLFEVKNYSGDFIIDQGRWLTTSGVEIKDPLLQLKRSESLLRQILQSLRFNFSIEPFVMFIHPEFTLYQASPDLPIILPTQFKAFMKKLNVKSVKRNESQTKLAEKLVSMHIPESPYIRLPEYYFDQLKKGIICKNCSSFVVYGPRQLTCVKCGHTESIEVAMLRSIAELKLLFPDKKITASITHDWCGGLWSKRTNRRILAKNFTHLGHNKSSYYVE